MCIRDRYYNHIKKYFRTAPSLPINQFYIRTATDTKEKIDTQYYLTIMLEKVQFEVCVVGINNLICDVLLGVDVLEQIRAEINTSEHLLKCNINNISYTFKLNTHTQIQEHGDPIKITRPPKQIIKYENGEQGETTLDSQTERRLSSLQEEFSDIFSCLLYTSRCV